MSTAIFLITIFVLFIIISVTAFTLSEKKFCFCSLFFGSLLGIFLALGYTVLVGFVQYVTDEPMEKEQHISAEVSEISLGEERNYVLTFPNEVYRKVYKGTDFRCNLSDDPILYSGYTYGPDTISGGCEILG